MENRDEIVGGGRRRRGYETLPGADDSDFQLLRQAP